MDNLTHSLFGYAVAAAAIKTFPRLSTTRGWAKYVIVGSVVANNIPDADILFSRPSSGSLDYLLSHRGYTHTLIAAIPEALLVFILLFGTRLIGKKPPFSIQQWVVIAGLLLIGPWIHIGLDALNSYGVHPFWPWNNHWFYGDSVFIVEPWFWISLIPALFYFEANKIAKAVLAALFAATFILIWATEYVPFFLAATATGLGLLSWYFARRGRFKRTAFFFVGLTFVSFIGTSFWLKKQVRFFHDRMVPETKLVDVVLSPMPANPICWTAITVEQVGKGKWVARKGIFSALNRVFDVKHCPKLRFDQGFANLSPVSLAPIPGVSWIGESYSDSDTFARLAEKNCEVSSFLQFARVPFFVSIGNTEMIGDLRFDLRNGGFARLLISKSTSCAQETFPWIAPRRDLLQFSK